MSGNRQKRLVLTLLAAIVAFLYVISPTPGYSQSSLQGMNGCVKDPICAATLKDMGPGATALGGANNIVPFTRLPPGGLPPVTIPAAGPAAGAATGGFPWGVVAPAAGGGMLLYPWGKPESDKLNQGALPNACTMGLCPPGLSGSVEVRVFQEGELVNKFRWSVTTPFSVNKTFYPAYNAEYWDLFSAGGVALSRFANGWNQTATLGDFQPNSGELDKIPEGDRPRLFEQGGGGLIPGILADAPPTTLSPGDTIEGGNITEIGPDGQPRRAPSPYVVGDGPAPAPGSTPSPSPDPNSDTNKDTDGDGQPDSTDPDIDGDGLPNTSDPDIDGDGLPNSEDPDFQGNKAPPPTAEPTGDLPSSPRPSQFKKPNFLQYGWQVFSQKFPLDIIGVPPTDPAAINCPTLTFWGKPFELCIVRDFISALQVPIVISFIIWAVLAL